MHFFCLEEDGPKTGGGGGGGGGVGLIRASLQYMLKQGLVYTKPVNNAFRAP